MFSPPRTASDSVSGVHTRRHDTLNSRGGTTSRNDQKDSVGLKRCSSPGLSYTPVNKYKIYAVSSVVAKQSKANTPHPHRSESIANDIGDKDQQDGAMRVRND